MAKPVIDLVIADKSPLVLAGLTDMFGADDRFDLLATAADGERFMEAVERLSFDVGVIGWSMPFMSGADVLDALGEHDTPPRVVVYTGDTTAAVPRRAMLKGGAGFCSKQDDPETLIETVMAVAEGRMVFPFIDMSKPMADPFGTLTGRERELLSALSEGMTNALIAEQLGISVNTVKFHLKNLYEKLEVSSRSHAISLYLKGSG
ncbi:MAG: response regulator transcription factor [Alphaproteobacteria bacterium]|jgi:two-component system, NarL family, nitrate/nitrite response regulator NarL|nr:response regulator transcription factor [Alphaproteobacteria bacterium]MBT7943051.1 response regulator transcription factor [Alphaproteobacteria bacterium]